MENILQTVKITNLIEKDMFKGISPEVIADKIQRIIKTIPIEVLKELQKE